jgi:hypothetical protein
VLQVLFLVQQDLKEILETQDRLDQLVHKDLKVFRDQLVHRVYRVSKVFKEFKEFKV